MERAKNAATHVKEGAADAAATVKHGGQNQEGGEVCSAHAIACSQNSTCCYSCRSRCGGRFAAWWGPVECWPLFHTVDACRRCLAPLNLDSPNPLLLLRLDVCGHLPADRQRCVQSKTNTATARETMKDAVRLFVQQISNQRRPVLCGLCLCTQVYGMQQHPGSTSVL